jgi:hypothetical protein
MEVDERCIECANCIYLKRDCVVWQQCAKGLNLSDEQKASDCHELVDFEGGI